MVWNWKFWLINSTQVLYNNICQTPSFRLFNDTRKSLFRAINERKYLHFTILIREKQLLASETNERYRLFDSSISIFFTSFHFVERKISHDKDFQLRNMINLLCKQTKKLNTKVHELSNHLAYICHYIQNINKEENCIYI